MAPAKSPGLMTAGTVTAAGTSCRGDAEREVTPLAVRTDTDTFPEPCPPLLVLLSGPVLPAGGGGSMSASCTTGSGSKPPLEPLPLRTGERAGDSEA